MLSFQTIRQFVQTHPRKVAAIALALILIAALNIWVLSIARTSGFPTTSKPIRIDTEKSLAPGAREVKPSPTPTPRPTGPGQFACSPEATCNLYSDTMREQYCTTTYADSLCLDQCGDKAKQCTK